MSPPVLKPSVPIPIDDKVLIDVISKAKDFAIMHGSAMRSKANFSPDTLQVKSISCWLKILLQDLLCFQFAPFILTPSSFPRNEFKKAVEIQPILNELMHNVAMDSEFLKSTLRSTVEVDEFTGELFKIYEKVLEEGISQVLSFLLNHFFALGFFFNSFYFLAKIQLVRILKNNSKLFYF